MPQDSPLRIAVTRLFCPDSPAVWVSMSYGDSFAIQIEESGSNLLVTTERKASEPNPDANRYGTDYRR